MTPPAALSGHTGPNRSAASGGRTPHAQGYGTLTNVEESSEGTIGSLFSDSTRSDLDVISKDQLQDLRAAQRTFDLAYMRTSLGGLCFALLVLRLFQTSFQSAGLLYALLSVAVGASGILRSRIAMQNFRDSAKIRVTQTDPASGDALGYEYEAVGAMPAHPPFRASLYAHQGEQVVASDESAALLPQDSPYLTEAERQRHIEVVIPTTFTTAGNVVGPLSLATIVLEASILVAILFI